MDTTSEESATPMFGEVKPLDIIVGPRREIDEGTLANLVKDLERLGRFLNPIAVRAEDGGDYRLIAGYHRLEAWKQHFGEQAPIPATIYPSDNSDAEITVLEMVENLHRSELSAAEREAQTLRLAAMVKRLAADKVETEFRLSGSEAKSAPNRGRGRKAMTAKLADELGITGPGVRKRIKGCKTAIDEPIDLDRDSPEELERKAIKRLHVESKFERPKRRTPARRAGIEDSTQLDELEADADSPEYEELVQVFHAAGRRDRYRFILYACECLAFDPFKMAPPSAFGLADEEPEFDVDALNEAADHDAINTALDEESEAPVAIVVVDDLSEAAEWDHGNVTTETQAESQDGAADVDAEDLDDAGDDEQEISYAAQAEPPDVAGDDDLREAEEQGAGGTVLGVQGEPVGGASDDGDLADAADQEPGGAVVDAEHQQDAAVGHSESAVEEPGGGPSDEEERRMKSKQAYDALQRPFPFSSHP